VVEKLLVLMKDVDLRRYLLHFDLFNSYLLNAHIYSSTGRINENDNLEGI
jgi:hypothetical protein